MKESTDLEKRVDAVLASPASTVQENVECLMHPALSDEVTRERRLELLKQTLQQAVELEFATIPLYLTALWSIKNNLHPVAKSIRNVVQEEMLHLSLASNMLASIGGKPKLYDPGEKGLRFPTGLPGGVHPALTLRLSGLTDDALEDFLEVELPLEEISIEGFHSKYSDATGKNSSATIGAMYDAIRKEFESLKPAMSPDNQISGPLAWFVVDTIEKVDSAINWIKEQGEGAVQPSTDKTNPKSLSHFYRFWEVRARKRIEYDAAKGKFVFGAPLEFPEVWPMAVVPKGGYLQQDVSEDVWALLCGFDRTYSHVVKLLESAWGGAGQAAMWKAIEVMFDLEKTAIPLMQIPRPDGKGNYGPAFRMVPIDDRPTSGEPRYRHGVPA
jgi:rubrerythrin